jgi:hypothetical protein
MAYACEEQGKAINRQRAKRRYEYGVAVLRRLKTIKGCACCGFRGHHASFEYNHLEPNSKLYNVQKKAHLVAYSRTAPCKIKLKQELAKCEVLCRNCHGVHTFENKHYEKRLT